MLELETVVALRIFSSTSTSLSKAQQPHHNITKTLLRTPSLKSKQAMAEVANRIVPGAPPPTAASKSQKKKRKSVKAKDSGETDSSVVPDTATASVLEKALGLSDIKEGDIAPGVVATTSVSASDVPHSALEEEGYKPSPVVDLVHKRLKAIHKKIVSNQLTFRLSTVLVFLRNSHARRVSRHTRQLLQKN